MSDPRRSAVYVIRIWREPSRLAPPGEWRGTLRSVDGTRNVGFRTPDELWRILTVADDTLALDVPSVASTDDDPTGEVR